MSDLIDRQMAIDAIERNACNTQRIFDAITALPSAQPKSYREGYQAGFKDAQPERKKGKWITSDDMYETGVCSVCKCDSQEPVSYAITMFKYCPNCGAEMEVSE